MATNSCLSCGGALSDNAVICQNCRDASKGCCQQGESFYTSGHIPNAIQCFDIAVKFNPSDRRSVYSRGKAHLAQAIHDLQLSVQIPRIPAAPLQSLSATIDTLQDELAKLTEFHKQ